MTAKRPPLSAKMRIDALLDRADYFGSPITCAWCGNPLKAQTPIQWDHSTALALGGEHTFRNIHPMHVACHHEKTFGNGASTAGSDIGKISKERRIIRTQKMAVRKSWPDCDHGGYVGINCHKCGLTANETRQQAGLPINMIDALREALRPPKPKRKLPSRKMRSRPWRKSK